MNCQGRPSKFGAQRELLIDQVRDWHRKRQELGSVKQAAHRLKISVSTFEKFLMQIRDER